MKKYKLIGLTGPTGSGKGIVTKILKEHGCAIIDADCLARNALQAESVCVKTLAFFFGSDIINNDKTVNRKLLAQRAFSSKKNTELLNSVTHPHIMMLVFEKIKQLSSNGYKTIIFDAPVLFESNADVICDYIAVVIANKEKRIERIIKRDNITVEQAMQRINAQHSNEYYTEKADIVIENNTDISEIQEKAKQILLL